MTSPAAEPLSLRAALKRGGAGRIIGAGGEVGLGGLVGGSVLGCRLSELAGRSVLVRTREAFAAALALIDLDGIARRIVLCPPDLADDQLAGVRERAGVEATVSDREGDGLAIRALAPDPALSALPRIATEWVLFTSGTTGAPKMVGHSLAGLTDAIQPRAPGLAPSVWSTFYDIRRYGGLQILLRGVLGGGTLVLAGEGEPLPTFVDRLAAAGVTHLSGTPSHWRRLLMSGLAGEIAPGYVRLSGEIADQAVLDSLGAAYPHAKVGHAYASTEAGVGFEVDDGLEGFPAAYLDREGAVAMRVVDGSLHLRSARAASGYVGDPELMLQDAEGFVDSGDMIERRGERHHFVGRRSGVINVGGLKVHPEEVEAVINRHPAVRASRVAARRSPITGALVVAEVQPADPAAASPALEAAILNACRAALAPHKVPTRVRFVEALAVTAGGKLERRGA